MPSFQEFGSEDTAMKNAIIIHPGSLYIRIGRASDINPVTLLHAVATKRYTGGASHVDSLLPQVVLKNKDDLKEIEESRLQVSRFLQSQNQSSGRRRYVTPPQQIAAFNRRVSGQVLNASGGEWYQTDDTVVIGDEILNLDPQSDYNVHFPIRRGELNLHKGIGGSLMSVLENLTTIWSYIIRFHLGIDAKDFKDFKCVLVIPDVFNRSHARELMNLLLRSMKFGSCFLLQDHVAATFGAGLSYACVVDVGHEKTSISCVEDGISLPNTRVKMGYGGADITQTFHWLLQKCAFPYSECDPTKLRLDAYLMQKLKHDFCHVHLDVCGCYEKTFVIRQPKKSVQRYTIQVGDECIIAVLSVFHPELLGITGPKSVTTQTRTQSHFEDPLDAEYLRETSRRGTKESLEGMTGETLPDSGSLTTQITGEDDLAVETIAEGCSQQTTSTSEFLNAENNHPVGLDVAIVRCIERYGNEEQRRKFYSSILVIGGGIKFPGITEFLENKLSKLISPPHQTEMVEVIMSSKEIDSENTAWKGAAIMATLESAQELWIQAQEWEKYGVKLLREKSVFIW
ncbi:actin-related protein 8 [Planococcus citri]|uniref:actin-related protein 8 n=1 Tax=Planococcus citri TaxID=170843 RepID=UPI0031F7E237